ncbi:MAG: RnfABCDGE type electron transport complex subunit D [Tenericutes bacterium]|nr:RnfABCDGE type electron transport complex subunit D [Mycoplasmatota bacterium]
MARFSGGKAPFLRISDTKGHGTNVLMRDFIIGLLPVILFAWYKNGILVYSQGNINFFEMLYPLFFIIVGGLGSVLMEAIFFLVIDKEIKTPKQLMEKLSTSYAAIPGLILALMLPVYTPIWVLLFGCFIANIVGKSLFGGFGHNIWNPALLGYAVIKVTLMGVINAAGSYLNVSEVLVDSYAGATPLAMLAKNIISYDALVTPYGGLWNLFAGFHPGGLGETSFLVMIISYIWLSARKVIRWQTPLLFVSVFFGLSWVVGALNGVTDIWFPLYSIFTGGIMFGAVFMITEPVTTPRNPLGKTIFILFLAVLTILFRYVGNLPEGFGTAIILMNIFALPIDKFSAIIKANRWDKVAYKYIAIIFGILIVLGLYAVLKAGNSYNLFIPLIQIGGAF